VTAAEPPGAPLAGDLTGARVAAGPATGGAARAPVLFVHGLFAGAWMFAGWQRRFAARGRASVALDLRGHHGSRPVAEIGRVSMRDYIADALDVARTMDRPVVVGHSMGGLVALALAEAGAVRAAVLLCSAPPRGILPGGPALLRRQLKHLPALLRSRPLFPDRADADALIFTRVPAAERDALYARLVPDSGRAARDLSLGAIAVDARRVRVPVLSVTALDDRFVAPRAGAALARRYGATLLRLDGFAHLLPAEPGWERAADAVLDWIDGVERAP